MRIEDYPENTEISELREVIINLEKTQHWGAVELAKIDLYYLLKQREKWVKS